MVGCGSRGFGGAAWRSAFVVLLRETATIENSAPAGFQHFVQPHTWLNATLPLTSTVTGEEPHRHASVPPSNCALPGLTPPSTAGWMEVVMFVGLAGG